MDNDESDHPGEGSASSQAVVTGGLCPVKKCE